MPKVLRSGMHSLSMSFVRMSSGGGEGVEVMHDDSLKQDSTVLVSKCDASNLLFGTNNLKLLRISLLIVAIKLKFHLYLQLFRSWQQ